VLKVTEHFCLKQQCALCIKQNNGPTNCEQ